MLKLYEMIFKMRLPRNYDFFQSVGQAWLESFSSPSSFIYRLWFNKTNLTFDFFMTGFENTYATLAAHRKLNTAKNNLK